MENEIVAVAISEYLHSLDVTQPLAYYMARGLSINLSLVAVAAQHSVQPTIESGRVIRAMDMDDIRNPRYKIIG
jgi:hypothetical protein